MKICKKCFLFYPHPVMSCYHCDTKVEEIPFTEALKVTQQRALSKSIVGQSRARLSDAHIQYHVRSYLKNQSLFLDFDLHKNRLKHGRRLKRFFIAPINITSIINIPWFLFNVISSNLFHLQYTEYCPICDTKYIPGKHNKEECDYNIEYFHILDDIICGRIVDSRCLYEVYAKERRKKGLQSAYDDLFLRQAFMEAFLDLLSIGSTILFWIYEAVYISFPMFKVLIQKLQNMEYYEWTFLTLR